MLIHTALRNGNIPPVRGVTGLPGAMSGCGTTCTSRGLPGVVGISGGSKVARWDVRKARKGELAEHETVPQT